MASIERTAYPRFKRYFTVAELTEIYTPSPTEIAFGLTSTSGPKNFLNFMVLLKSFQRLGYFPKIADIPTETISQSAYVMDNPADLINVGIEVLIKDRYELPGFNTLDRLVRRLRTLVNQKLFEQIIGQLDEDYLTLLDNLLEIQPFLQRTPYNELKKLPKKSSRNHLNDLLVHLMWLESKGDVSPYLREINQSKLSHWAAEAKALDASEIKKITQPKRATLLLCALHSATVNTRDSLVTMFLKPLNKIHHKAKEELRLLREKLQEKIENVVSAFTDVLQVFAPENPEQNETENESLNSQSLEQIVQIIKLRGGVEHLLSECDAINAYKGNNYLPLIWRFYKSHRSAFFRLINALELSSTSNDKTLIEALHFLKNNAFRRGEWLSPIDLSFASSQWQKLVLVRRGEHLKMSRRHFEVCVFSYLAAELKSGDICVKGSREYADYREQLLSWENCESLVDEYCQNLGFPSQPDEFVKHLKSWLEETAITVDKGYPNNTQVIINEDGEPVLKRSAKKSESVSVKALESLIEERIPERNLIDILKNVDY